LTGGFNKSLKYSLFSQQDHDEHSTARRESATPAGGFVLWKNLKLFA
jgi:hypothetical protein